MLDRDIESSSSADPASTRTSAQAIEHSSSSIAFSPTREPVELVALVALVCTTGVIITISRVDRLATIEQHPMLIAAPPLPSPSAAEQREALSTSVCGHEYGAAPDLLSSLRGDTCKAAYTSNLVTEGALGESGNFSTCQPVDPLRLPVASST